MSRRRTRNLFIAAIALSLLVHLFLAGYIHWPLDLRSREETRVAKIQLTTIAKVVPHTPPPPTPAAKSSIAPPVITSKNAGPKTAPRNVMAPVRPLTPAPVPSLTPTPGHSPTIAPSTGPCGGHKNAEAGVEATPEPADIPPEARAAKITGTAQIKVSLDAQGHVSGTAIAQSSGDAGLDAVADKLARAASYTPKYVDCKGVAGEFVFSVHFTAL